MRISVPTAVVLDTAPLSLLAQKRNHLEGDLCRAWSRHVIDTTRSIFFIPEVADYEVRRELLRLRNYDAVNRLEALRDTTIFLPLTTSAILLAADLWARTRQAGRPTSHPHALDADALISAQAHFITLDDYGLSACAIATVDVGDMTALAAVGPPPSVPAALWSDIQP